MRAKFVIGCLLSSIWCSAVSASDAQQFCKKLQTNHAVPLGPYALYYENQSGQPVIILSGDSIPRIGSLFYYIHADAMQFGKPGLLNVKMVFKTDHKIAHSRYVYVHNDVWLTYSNERQRQIGIDCANVDPQGYEDFHLGSEKNKNYCLLKHFHQKQPIDTLATPEKRRSFAFQDMLNLEQNSAVAGFFGLFSPAPALAGEQNATETVSDIRSSIRNFTFVNGQDNCLEIKPSIPGTADTAYIRITFHAGSFDYIDPRDWKLKFSK
jgi:hypothetical protein